MDRTAYSRGIAMLLELQHTYTVRKRPLRSKVAVLVQKLVRKSGMAGDPRERYFSLLCGSALCNREPMYSNWDRSKRKKQENR